MVAEQKNAEAIGEHKTSEPTSRIAVEGFPGEHPVVMDLGWVEPHRVFCKTVSLNGNLTVAIARDENGPWKRSMDDYAYSMLHSTR